MNVIKTGFLLAVLTLILVYAGQLLAGPEGMLLALIFAALMNFTAFFFSDKIALRMSGAVPVTREQAPRMYRLTESLCQRAGLPLPRLYVIPQAQPNAFATGRNPQKAAVACTAGLLETMEDDELEGVIAHELAHVKNRDTLIMSVAATIAGAISYLGWVYIFGGRNRGGHPLVALALLILAPMAAMLVQLAISRQREYAADAAAARMVGHPYGLAKALEKLGHYTRRIPMRNVQPSQAHMYIAQPFTGGGMARLFSTHPPLEERIRRLRSQAA